MFDARYDETKPFIPLGIAVLAVSDTRTLQTDTSGALLAEMAARDGHTVIDRQIVTDDADKIAAIVKAWIADPRIDVVLTTGGTGFTPRDVTPEALEPLFDKRMEGFSVLFHQLSATNIGTSTLQSRATAGLCGETLVFCLPGSRGACRDGWEGILKHQLDVRHLPCNFIEILPRFG
ncbi:MAG TPA: molybdenum cofactor biosynthesis protein B [Devosiaceae bacterium]|nr:molybdenum cofactor biosynthesis protein B [Devosiaceae bacterium]